MDSSQVKAAEVVLRKALPDLQTIAHTGPAGGPLEVSWLPPPAA